MTGVFNRRYLEGSLEREVRRPARNGMPIGIIMLDVDDFQRFNDTFGHSPGGIRPAVGSGWRSLANRIDDGGDLLTVSSIASGIG
jgi:predicted signal transduction protein with EAL and GGDEF domain